MPAFDFANAVCLFFCLYVCVVAFYMVVCVRELIVCWFVFGYMFVVGFLCVWLLRLCSMAHCWVCLCSIVETLCSVLWWECVVRAWCWVDRL